MKKVSFENNRGETLRGYVHVPKKYDTALVFLHGFPGTMFKTGFRVCKGLKKFLCLRFEFSGTNTSEGKFEDKLISQEVKEVKSAVDFLFKNYDFKRLVLAGTSTGAVDAALACNDKRIDKLVLMGCVSKLDEAVRYDFTDRQVYDFWKKGYIVYRKKDRFYTGKRLNKAFYDEFFKLDIVKSLNKFKRPVLILQGTEDDCVPPFEAKKLYKMINKPKKLVYVKGADHSYTKRAHMKKVVKEIEKFGG